MSYYELSEVGGRLAAAREIEARVTYWLGLEMAFGVILPPMRLRDETESRFKFESSIDLRVFAGDGEQRRVRSIEAKGKKVRFTTPESWPFEDVTLFAANKTYDPHAIVLCSMVADSALVVLKDDTWFKGIQRDNAPGRNNLEYEVWKAPRSSLISWDAFMVKLWSDLLGKARPEDINRALVAPGEPPIEHRVDDATALFLTS